MAFKLWALPPSPTLLRAYSKRAKPAVFSMLGAGYACGNWRPQAASCEEGPALIRYLFTARLRNQQFPRAGAGRRAEIIPRQARVPLVFSAQRDNLKAIAKS